MSPNFVKQIKDNIRVINLLLFGVAALGWLLSLLIYGYLLNYFLFNFILQILAPAFGFVYLFVLSKGKTQQQHALYLGITHCAGLVLSFVGLFGVGILSILAYIAGAAANGIVYFSK
jgi:hypothetical protein